MCVHVRVYIVVYACTKSSSCVDMHIFFSFLFPLHSSSRCTSMYLICIVQSFEPQGRRFINFLYYYYYHHYFTHRISSATLTRASIITGILRNLFVPRVRMAVVSQHSLNTLLTLTSTSFNVQQTSTHRLTVLIYFINQN